MYLTYLMYLTLATEKRLVSRRSDTIPRRQSRNARIAQAPPTAGDSNRRPGLAMTHGVRARHDQLTNAALAAWFGEISGTSVKSQEPKRPSSVRLACRHGRMSTDRERPRPKIVPRRQVACP